ncbi:MAG: alpha/beta hydrolase, partial [Actinomycetota bacterium]|nr:alpha/beta hydrolase [Actinomycetota bacterium]
SEVVANGIRFHVQQLAPPQAVTGDVPTVVFIHGLVMDNLSSFYYTLANSCAAGGARVMLYDLRGHGRSERPATGYSLNDSVADLEQLLIVLGIAGPVHLVGNSYGGAVALAFGVAHPDQVASMVMIEAHFAVQGWGEEMARTLWSVALGMELEDARAFVAAAGRKMTRMANKADLLINHTSLIEDLLTGVPLPRASVQAIGCPVLAVYGDESDVIDRARDLGRLVDDFTLNVLTGCGHSILMEVPAYLRQVMAWWLGGREGPEPVYYLQDDVAPPAAPALASLVP